MVKSACTVGDPGSVPGSGRSPGAENDNPLQYSCLENSKDREAWQPIVHGVTKSQAHLNDFDFTFTDILKHQCTLNNNNNSKNNIKRLSEKNN